MAKKKTTPKKKKQPNNKPAKKYVRKTRAKLEGCTLVTPFPMENDLHDMVTEHQRKERDAGNDKPNFGEAVNALLRELKTLKNGQQQ